jgi:hypothetical protein
MQLALSIASIVLSLGVIWRVYRMQRQLDMLEAGHRALCEMLGIRHET